MNTNHPEKPHFDRIIAVEREIAELKLDLKERWKSAKYVEGVDVKVLKRAVKLALENDDTKKERRELEDHAENLLVRLGQLADTPLGQAAVAAAE